MTFLSTSSLVGVGQQGAVISTSDSYAVWLMEANVSMYFYTPGAG